MGAAGLSRLWKGRIGRSVAPMNPALLSGVPLLALAATVQPAPQPMAVPPLQAPGVALPSATPDALLAYSDAGSRMTVPVTIGSPDGTSGPFAFIVDTGAERTVISRELAAMLKLARGRDVRVTAMSGTASVQTAVIPRISTGVMGGARIEAPMLIERNLGAPGLLGIDTLRDHAVVIDFDRQVMSIAPSARRRRSERAGPDEIVVHARDLLGQLVVTDASYRGTRVRVILDTGSVVSMGNPAFRKLAARARSVMRPISLLGVTGVVLNADYTTIDQVKVGDLAFGDLPVAFADAAPFARFGLVERPAMLLGMDALRLFRRVRIDFPNREVRLLLPRDAAAARVGIIP